MADFSALELCAELTMEHAEAAVASRDAMGRLLAHIGKIARPMEGCPKIMLVLGRLARGDVTWVGGEVRAELIHDDEGATKLSILRELGSARYEPLFPAVRLDAPLDEFVRAATLAPKLTSPLVAEESEGRLLLVRPPGAAASTRAGASVGSFDLDDPSTEYDALLKQAALSPPVPAQAAAAPAIGSVPKDPPAVHSRPTVPRMPAINPASLTKRRDPRREDDD